MRTPARRGFTLPELMVVISIIALLLTMALPTFQRVFASVRTTLCANNLEKIGQAVHGWNATAELDPNLGKVSATTWTGLVTRWSGNNQEVLICPEGETDAIGGPFTIDELSMLYVYSYGPNRWTGIWEATEYTLGQGMEEGWPVGIENRSMFWQVITKSSNSITLAMEDSWQDNSATRDYKDLIIRFDFSSTKTTVTYVSEGTGAFHYSLHYPNGDTILEGMGEGSNHGKEGSLSAGIQSLRKTSYGMNRLAGQIIGPKRVVLVLDYNKSIADCAGADAEDPLVWEQYIAPRHLGKCNVLLDNGAVEAMYPDEIDPRTTRGLEQWGP